MVRHFATISKKAVGMGTYLIKAKYTAEAFKGMLESPSDRAGAYRELADAVGIEVREIFFSLSSSEITSWPTATRSKWRSANW